jgi:hypothetical protein
MQDCQVCGRRFDPLSFQVIVPELARGFDRVECARSARALGSRATPIAATPLGAIAEPFTAAALPAAAAAYSRLRPAPAQLATFGLLAAGAAAAAFLWLRVLGPDTAAFEFSRAAVPPAFAHESVQAHVQPSSTHPAARPAAGEPSRAPVTVSSTAILVSSAPSPSGSVHRSPASRPVARPQTQATNDRHHGRGEGHVKHGETDGVHSPGHGHHGNGGGKGLGKGKHKH